MSEKLPYEEQLDQAWDTLPLPDEDMAWKDMKRRLDKDDDDKIVAPPPRKGCGIGALLIGLLLLSGLWFILRPEKWFIKKETETTQQTNDNANKNEVKKETKVEDNGKSHNNDNGTNIDAQDEKTKTTISNDSITTRRTAGNDKDTSKVETKDADVRETAKRSEPLTIKDNLSIQTNHPPTKKRNAKTQIVKTNKPGDVSDSKTRKPENNDDRKESALNQKKDTVENTVNNNVTKDQKDSVKTETKPPASQTNIPSVTDSSKNKNVQPIVTNNKDSVIKNTNTAKQKDKEERPVFFSAGLGLHQQIPIAGQEWTSYGSLGRKGILTDYIPSINFRMEKQDRWFLQTEFRYGAPQHTKQVTYSQLISIDTFSQSIITNSSVLKKTFYHQVPLTFNYYVLPGWSVGTGLQWNRFHSAVAEQEVKKRRPGTTIDSIITKDIVKVSNDSSSALARSWLQAIIQTQYQWKRFSIGARYSFGLQPYIKFALPNQPLQQEKNSSFQVFLRYELWRSRLRD